MTRAWLVVLALSSTLHAQVLPPGKAWAIMPDARARLDSIARAALDSKH